MTGACGAYYQSPLDHLHPTCLHQGSHQIWYLNSTIGSYPLHLMLLQCADNFDNPEHVKRHHARNILNTGKISMQLHVVMSYV